MGEGEGNGTPLQYSCLENPMDRGAWKAAVHGVAKSWTWLNNFTFTFHFHALEKETATHFNVLAWRIPGMGEPGGLPSMGSHRVRHDWSNLAAEAAKWEKARHEPMKVVQISSKIKYCPVPVLGYVSDEKMSSCRSLPSSEHWRKIIIFIQGKKVNLRISFSQKEGVLMSAYYMQHMWTLEILCQVKEARCKRPYCKLEITTLSEANQKEKDKYHMISLICCCLVAKLCPTLSWAHSL